MNSLTTDASFFCSPLIYGPSSFNAVVGFGLMYSRTNQHRTSSGCCPSDYSRGIFKVPHRSQRTTLTCKQPPAPLIRPKLRERRQVHADREHDRAGAWQKQQRLSLDAQTDSYGGGFGGAGLEGRVKHVVFGPNVSSCKLFQGDDVGGEVGGSTWISQLMDETRERRQKKRVNEG